MHCTSGRATSRRPSRQHPLVVDHYRQVPLIRRLTLNQESASTLAGIIRRGISGLVSGAGISAPDDSSPKHAPPAHPHPMTSKDYAPLTADCVRLLNDRTAEKRKDAAAEIEKLVRELVRAGKAADIERLLSVLGADFARANNPNTRKGGVLGLASVAVALQHPRAAPYSRSFVEPMLACLQDTDSRVRYYAAEALHNTLKVLRTDSLPLLRDLFDALGRLTAEATTDVRQLADEINNILKTVLLERPSAAPLDALVEDIRARLYADQARPLTRKFLVDWISLLNELPEADFSLEPHYPALLDGLLALLADQHQEIRRSAERLLAAFLARVEKHPERANLSVLSSLLVNRLGTGVESNALVSYTAMVWLERCVALDKGRTLLPRLPSILSAVLPHLEAPSSSQTKQTHARQDSDALEMYELFDDDVRTQVNRPPSASRQTESQTTDERDRARLNQVANMLNSHLLGLVTSSPNASPSQATFDLRLLLGSLGEVFTSGGREGDTATKVASLLWIFHLLTHMPTAVVPFLEKEGNLFQELLNALSDPSDRVVLLDCQVLAQLFEARYDAAKSDAGACTFLPADYFRRFMTALLGLFAAQRDLLFGQDAFRLRQLCAFLRPEAVYRTLALLLAERDDLTFVGTMVRTLNGLLLSSAELFPLRLELRDSTSSANKPDLFLVLYGTWVNAPISAITLCLLAGRYNLAAALVSQLVRIDVDSDLLAELDQLVSLLESPVFAPLRLELVAGPSRPALLHTLYGLLMLLPQTEAFHTLRRRLAALPPLSSLPDILTPLTAEEKSLRDVFVTVGEKQEAAKRMERRARLTSASLLPALIASNALGPGQVPP